MKPLTRSHRPAAGVRDARRVPRRELGPATVVAARGPQRRIVAAPRHTSKDANQASTRTRRALDAADDHTVVPSGEGNGIVVGQACDGGAQGEGPIESTAPCGFAVSLRLPTTAADRGARRDQCRVDRPDRPSGLPADHRGGNPSFGCRRPVDAFGHHPCPARHGLRSSRCRACDVGPGGDGVDQPETDRERPGDACRCSTTCSTCPTRSQPNCSPRSSRRIAVSSSCGARPTPTSATRSQRCGSSGSTSTARAGARCREATPAEA